MHSGYAHLAGGARVGVGGEGQAGPMDAAGCGVLEGTADLGRED